MSRTICVAAASAGLVLAATGRARAAELLVGVAQEQFQADLDSTDPADTIAYTIHHASTAFAAEWSPNENLKLRLALGTITSNLEPGTSSIDGGLYMLLGVSLEQELTMGGGLLLDLSYSFGRSECKDGGIAKDYDHRRTGFLVSYIFGAGERARPYAGVAYNTYESELTGGGERDEFENDQRFSIVAGVRARSGTFAGQMEATVLGELGVRLTLMFGF